MLTLASPDEFYVLQYKKEVKISFSTQKITNFYHNQLLADLPEEDSGEGIDDALEMVYEISESINSGVWIESLFFYTNGSGKISYSLMGKSFTFQHTDKKK